MPNIKILIADSDEKYIMALERRFIDGYDKQCSLNVITDKAYLDKLFGSPQSFDIMIVNEQMYDPQFVKHEINNIFVLTEQQETATATLEMNVSRIYKYSSAKEIHNEIVSNLSPESAASARKRTTEIISVYSPSGGSGKTTLSMGLCAALSKKYKKVLYIGMDSLQSFGSFMKSPSYIQGGFETPMKTKSEYIASVADSIIKNELFSILPPFSKSLPSMDIGCGEYLYLAGKLRETEKYDFIVIDGDSVFGSDISGIMSAADKVIVLAEYSIGGAAKLGRLLDNIDCSDEAKFSFVCSKYKAEKTIAFSRNFSLNIPFYENCDELDYEQLAERPEIEELALKFI